MPSVQAKREYVGLVRSIAPHWRDTPPSEEGRAGKGKGGGGPVISTLMSDPDEVSDENKTAFDWCKEGHVTKLASTMTESNVNSLDEQASVLS